ncbi:uncharacterized protein LOC122296709 [Carya illinoinensis]|uniref:uncharacterized protein LOC122296709 n=1 Tax=Carya illinoinensis TaxID=32201 RepID=UPI001C71F56F|nr:uncharacterized protein LOC122296709 [Carya illinoinensis]
MKILSWNCRGLGNPQTVQTFRMFVKEKLPDVVFLMETKIPYARAHGIAKTLNFNGCYVSEAVGRSGGLILLWKQKDLLELVIFSKHHFNVMVNDAYFNFKWLLTCFYGHPNSNLRKQAWSLLSSFKPGDEGWGVIGDFNEILFNDEKVGGKPRNENLMCTFRNLLEEGNLLDLGWKRNKFTWCNCHEDESFTKERLDRAIANPRWRLNYSKVSVESLPAICSDHSPILLSCSFEWCSAYKYHFSFKYEANWNKKEGCSEIVSEAWQGSNGGETDLNRILKKLDRTRKGLQKWSRHVVRDRNISIKEKTQLLSDLQS